MRLTLSVVALLGLAVATQTVQAQTSTGSPTTPAATPASGPIEFVTGPTYFQPTMTTSSSEPARRGLFGRRAARRGTTQYVSPTTPAVNSAPMTTGSFAPMSMPAVSSTGASTTGTKTEVTKTEGTKTEGVQPTGGTSTTTNDVTTAGYTAGSSSTQGTILPATYMMTADGRLVMVSSGTTPMMQSGTMMPTETMPTTTTRRGLFGRRR